MRPAETTCRFGTFGHNPDAMEAAWKEVTAFRNQ